MISLNYILRAKQIPVPPPDAGNEIFALPSTQTSCPYFKGMKNPFSGPRSSSGMKTTVLRAFEVYTKSMILRDGRPISTFSESVLFQSENAEPAPKVFRICAGRRPLDWSYSALDICLTLSGKSAPVFAACNQQTSIHVCTTGETIALHPSNCKISLTKGTSK